MVQGAVTDPGVREAFARDASGMELIPESVTRPASVAEAAEVLRQASVERVSVASPLKHRWTFLRTGCPVAAVPSRTQQA